MSLKDTYQIISDAEIKQSQFVENLRKRFGKRRKISIAELQKRHGHDSPEFKLAFAIVTTQ